MKSKVEVHNQGYQGDRGGLQDKLKAIIDANNHMKANGKGSSSFQTRDDRKERLFRIFKILRTELKYNIQDPNNLKVKHIEALVKYWVEEKLSPSTIEGNLSLLRTLCGWMKKPGMVKGLHEYAPEVKRTYAAKTDKSFSAHQIDFWQVWDQVYAKDQYVGMQLLLVKAFGARRKEAVMFKPLVSGKPLYIELYDGTKGGRPRVVAIDDEIKGSVIAALKNFVMQKKGRASGHIGHPDKSLEQNIKHYSYVLRACGISKSELGVTGHGLRAEYAIDQLEKRGLVPTIRGGTGKVGTQHETDLIYGMVSEDLGHSRKSVMTAYSGAMRPNKNVKPTNSAKSSQDSPVFPGQDSSGVVPEDSDA